MIISIARSCDYCERRDTPGHICSSLIEFLVGRCIDRAYVVTSLRGRGGMGIVARAVRPGLSGRFAVKIPNRRFRGDPRMTDRFAKEARLVSRVRSEHVVSATDFGVDEELGPYLVMEDLRGESLARILAAGPLSVARTIDLVSQAAAGVSAAHEAGVVHRDLKPANLFICRRDRRADRTKILDFGLADVEGAPSEVRRSRALTGTPAYMSPENARGARSIDRRTDIYALGLILYECLSGRRAHPGEDENQIVYHLLSQRPAPLSETFGELRAVVDKAMAPAADDRFQTAGQLRRALAAFAGSSGPRNEVGSSQAIPIRDGRATVLASRARRRC
jgi:serine/threonine protein kinase